jgi:hypothetical protein
MARQRASVRHAEEAVSVPTIHREGSWRFFFYSNEGLEPPHVHVEFGSGTAKFWLDPVALVVSGGISPRDLRRIQRVVEERRASFLRAWNEHLGR